MQHMKEIRLFPIKGEMYSKCHVNSQVETATADASKSPEEGAYVHPLQ